MVGLLRAWSFIRPPKNSLPTLAALVDNLFCLYLASPRRQNDHLCLAPPHKNNLF